MLIHSWLRKTYLCLGQLFFLSNLYSVSSFYDSVRNLCLTMCYLQTQISNMHRRNLSCLYSWVWNLVSRMKWGLLRGVSCEHMYLKMKEVTGYWRELQNEKLHKEYCSKIFCYYGQTQNDEPWGTCKHIGRRISIVQKIFITKTKRKRHFGRPKCRWECNIKAYVEGVWKGFIRIRTGVSRGLLSTQYEAIFSGSII